MPAPASQQLTWPRPDQPLSRHLPPSASTDAPSPSATTRCWKKLHSHSQADLRVISESCRNLDLGRRRTNITGNTSSPGVMVTQGSGSSLQLSHELLGLDKNLNISTALYKPSHLARIFNPFLHGDFLKNVIFEVSYLISILFYKKNVPLTSF